MLEPRLQNLSAPLKLMMRDVGKIVKCGDEAFPWKIRLPRGSPQPQSVIFGLGQVWLQGHINKVEGPSNDCIIMNDGSGDVKVVHCSRVPGDRSWITPGAYCGLIACVARTSGLLPVVAAIKLMNIDENKSCAEEMWPLEVEELSNLLTNKVIPTL